MFVETHDTWDEFSVRCRKFLDQYIPDPRRCFVAGGFFPRFYHRMDVRDIDIFVDGDDTFLSFREEYLQSGFKQIVTKGPKHAKLVDPHTNLCVDLIGFHRNKTPNHLLNFDFTICRIFFNKNRLGYIDYSDFSDIVGKTLRFTGKSMYAAGENNLLVRAKKYVDLGFKLNDNELTRMYQFLTSDEAKKYTMENSYA